VAYLDRQLSEYKTSTPFYNAYIEEKDTTPPQTKPVSITKTSDNKKNNHELAEQLSVAKTDLIKALANFPASALWLISKDEQSLTATNSDDADSFASELTVSITELKKDFLQLHQYVQHGESNHARYISCKQRMMCHLQQFPYSFEDLTTLADLIVYNVKVSGIAKQLLDHPNNTVSRVVENRLTASVPSAKCEVLDKFKNVYAAQYSQTFLFLPTHDLYALIASVITAEQRWLQARQDLVLANNKLVSFIVNQYKGNFLDFNDLVQEGQTGLLKAVDRFDYRLGFQFSTYAGYWIRQAISRSLSRSERSVRIPCEQVANINRVFRIKDQITAQTGREATIPEISAQTQLSCDDINTILAISQSSVPLEGYEDEDSEKSFAPVDFLEQQTFSHPIDEIAETELTGLIAEAIKLLSPREAKVVCCHFGVHSPTEMTLQEIGAELNLTRERIRQIQVIALNKIKNNYGHQLINFL
jgi:RNA polymerase sigma factor (sigma-70 family)